MSLQLEAEERMGRLARDRERELMQREDAAFAAAAKSLPRKAG